MSCTLLDAYQLIHDGALALSVVEKTGIEVDVPYLDRMITEVGDEIREKKQSLYDSDVWSMWRRQFGSEANLGSRQQLGFVLFDLLGLQSTAETKTGRKKIDETVLQSLDHPFTSDYLAIEKLKKLHGTYLKGIRSQVEGTRLHPFYSLHTTQTYRSSSQDPNFQNIPIRSPITGPIIRRAFIPREGYVLVEIDYAAIEVRIAACYHHDPTMIKYIHSGYDMHRDMAMECFKLKANQVSKGARQTAKNGFVFPEFYGSYYSQVAPGMWNQMVRDKLTLPDGSLLVEHLADLGITRLGEASRDGATQPGTFMDHVKRVEQRFWGKRFPVYARWREEWYREYMNTGRLQTLTGFVIDGAMKRNEVINYPVQGSAFHCLLWSLIRTVKLTLKRKMLSRVVGQIHDSMLLEVHQSEMADLLPAIRDIMCVAIRKVWPWIIVPLEIEMEASAVNWYEKKGISWDQAAI